MYDNLRDSLVDFWMEMLDLKEINVNNYIYKVEYFLGGGWKFLVLVCGLGRVNEDYVCVWCKCLRIEWWDISKYWFIKNLNFGCRIIIEIEVCLRVKKINCKVKFFIWFYFNWLCYNWYFVFVFKDFWCIDWFVN